MKPILSYPPKSPPVWDISGTGLDRGFYSTLSLPSLSNPGNLPGLELWLSTRFPTTLISDGATKFANGQSLSVTSNSGLQSGHTNWWVSFWVNATSVQNNAWTRMISRITGWQTAAGTEYYIGGYYHNSFLNINLYISDGTTLVNNAYQYHTKDVWNHIFCWYNPTTKQGYMMSSDGTVSSTGALPNNMQATSNSLEMGWPATSCDYSLDSVCMGKSSTNLGNGTAGTLAKTIRDTLNNGGAGLVYANLSTQQKSDWGLTSWWNMNEATGTRFDSHGTNNLSVVGSSPTTSTGIGAGTAAFNGDVISLWVDRSRNGRNLTQATASQRPTLKVQDVKDDSTIVLDVVDDNLTSGAVGKVIEGTLIEVTKNGVLVYRAKTGDAGNTTYFIGPNGGQQNLVEKLHFNRVLSDAERDQAVQFYRDLIPADNFRNLTNINSYWAGRKDIVEFPFINTSKVTLSSNTWNGCSLLKGFPSIDLSKATTVQGAWYNCTGLTSFPQLNLSSATNVSSAWFGCSSLTSFPAIDLPAATNIGNAWQNCTSLTSFPLIDVSNVIGMNTAWGGSGLTSFPALNLSKATSFYQAWQYCTTLVNFGQVNSSSVTSFDRAWQNCWVLTPFPLIDTSKGQTFNNAWDKNYALTSFPALNFSSATDFTSAWYNCNALATFPAKMFDASNCTNYTASFFGCALTQASVDNILVSISVSAATRNLSSGTLGINSGTSSAPGQAGYYAKAHLVGKGWTVTNNGTDPSADYSLTGDPGLGQNENWSVAYMKIPAAAKWAFSCI